MYGKHHFGAVICLLIGLGLALAGASCGENDAGREENGAPRAPIPASVRDNSEATLALERVEPGQAGASVATSVRLIGTGFAPGMEVVVGSEPATSVQVVSDTEATASFGPVALTGVGACDVTVTTPKGSDCLTGGFSFVFDADPIVFVHGYALSDEEWDELIGRFLDLGYPPEFLAPIRFADPVGSNLPNASQALPQFVDRVLEQTGAQKVDLVAHSMGAMSSRLWIKFHGGADKVRDYVSLAGTHHGSNMACLVWWLGESGREQCPAYAASHQDHNGVQWDLNGDPDQNDVDETPFGVEDGGSIHWNALWTERDVFDRPPHTCCLNQAFRGDCSDPVNIPVPWTGHLSMVRDAQVFQIVAQLVLAHHAGKP